MQPAQKGEPNMNNRKRTFERAHPIRLLLVLVATSLILGASIVITQEAAALRAGNVPVTSSIADAVDGHALQIQSDGVGVYANTKYVQSIVQGLGDWELDTNYSQLSTRNVWLDFTKPVPGSGTNGGNPVAPFNSGLAKVRFISKCNIYNVNMFTIPSGTTVHCPLSLGFRYDGNDYRVQMNPVAGGDVNPETDFVDITCNAVNSNAECINWTIVPNGIKGGCATLNCSVKQNIARLSKFVTVKGKTTLHNQGNFYMAFSIGLTNP
jgi:hypothetical protein